MERDMELICDLLEIISKHPKRFVSKSCYTTDSALKECSEEKLNYHIEMLHQAGLVEMKTPRHMEDGPGDEIGVTWEGHEFLDNLRTAGGWQAVKDKLGTKLQNASFKILEQIVSKHAIDNVQQLIGGN